MTKQEEIVKGYARFLFERTHTDKNYHAKSYDDLKDKDYWRWEAKEHVRYLHSQGAVLRVEGELPWIPLEEYRRENLDTQKFLENVARHLDNAGYVPTESLIEEVTSG